MLPAHTQELLTAAVDGELSSAERRVVDKLLRDSEAARVFHAHVQKNAERLRQLPPATPTDDLSASVLNFIADRCISPTPLPIVRRKRSWNAPTMLPWISMATAAGVLIAVSVGSYIYFVASERHFAGQKQPDVARQTIPKHSHVKKNGTKIPKPDSSETILVEVGPVPREVDPSILAKSGAPEMLPQPRIAGPDNIIATPPQPESEPFRVAIFRLSLILPLRDLDQPYPKQKLRDELKKDEVIRIDLFAKDSVRATEIVQTALKGRGHNILVDAIAQDRLKKKQKTEIVFYAECLTADEIAQLLEQLGADDKKMEAEKAGEGHFDKFVLAPFTQTDLSELAKLLGISAANLKLPKVKATGAIDPTRPLEQGTVGQLAANLPKSGSASRGNDKLTLLLPYGGIRANPHTSKEIKSFLEKRGERKLGAVPMMLVLRTIN